MSGAAFGLDFGTTNSAIALAVAGPRPPRLARFAAAKGSEPTFRSVLYFEPTDEGPVRIRAGSEAIASYLANEEGNGRLVQSLKSFLASRLFSATDVFGTVYRLEELIALVLRPLREAAERALGAPVQRAVVGRPVHFVSAASDEDDALAVSRLEAALRNAGFREILLEYEPVGAATHYERDLERDELILIADFGGGTSDFSLLRVGPSFRGRGSRGDSVLGHAGVGVAGDAFDGKIVRHVVAPELGRGTAFRSIFGRTLPVPAWIYGHLERWNHVSFLKSRKTMRILLDLRREALEPEKLDALIRVVEQDLGFRIHEAIERSKRTLSMAAQAPFELGAEGLVIEARIARTAFEAWIAEELAAIASCVDRLLSESGLQPPAVDRVFLTGGSSFVPAVRDIFEKRFGAARIRGGGELTSVASGLALRALEAFD